jgi:isopentenyl-diphosphate delta-isomerase
MDMQQFEARKREHIQHSLDTAHQAQGQSGLEKIVLVHEALPDLDFKDVRIQTRCLGKSLETPFYVAGMTAGHEDAWKINRTLAIACQERGWAMGVGSQRRDLETGDGGLLDQWKKLREEVPDLVLLANLGISQLISADMGKVRKIVRDLGAQALVVHTNALQETMQPEGTPHFRGCLSTLQNYCNDFGGPVVLKETGCGFSKKTLERVSSFGLAAIDLSGLGGTHWGRIEGARAQSDSVYSVASKTFANWGVPTTKAVIAAKEVLNGQTEIWASGGVRSGLDAAKLIALGAHRVGYAKPALEAALAGPEALRLWMETQEYELRVALFCTGSETCQGLRQKEDVWRPNDI